MKYQLRMFYADAANQTAGSKATQDCSEILSRLGFRNFDVPVMAKRNKIYSLMPLLMSLTHLFIQLKPGDTLLLQYPLLGINKWMKVLIKLFRIKGCRLICLIHDLDSLRQLHHAWTIVMEVERLNAFDVVIVHNRQMEEVLRANGLRVATDCLTLFDYLVSPEIRRTIAAKRAALTLHQGLRNRIVFAGNLAKSTFLLRLPELPTLNFNLYGTGYALTPDIEHISWAGTFDADELPAQLHGDFGLIWDGPDLEVCTGNLGEYLRYNNPHKASLYLLAGLPIIAPKGSAIAEFITGNKIGLTLDTLLDLPATIKALSEDEYQQMLKNLSGISDQLAQGGFLETLIYKSMV